MEHVPDRLVDHVRDDDPGGVLALHLVGSGAAGWLRPDSDIDLLLLVSRSLAPDERDRLREVLLQVSGWRGHADRWPAVAERRPVELTALVLEHDEPWRHALHDFQFGEWLRAEALAGSPLGPARDPDVVVLLASGLQLSRQLLGPPLTDLVAPVPQAILDRAVRDAVPAVLADLAGDERNALLTVARAVVTIETGRMVTKDEAATLLAGTLDPDGRRTLKRARDAYRGHGADPDPQTMAALTRELARRADVRPG